MLYVACTLLVLVSAAVIFTPLFKEPKGNLEVELLAETELDRLLNRKAVVYSNIKDLEFEYKLGRLSNADYARLETGYKAEAALILQKLDNLGVEKSIDENIEREISNRRAKRPESSLNGSAKALARCPSCGAETFPGKKFCADCGHSLA